MKKLNNSMISESKNISSDVTLMHKKLIRRGLLSPEQLSIVLADTLNYFLQTKKQFTLDTFVYQFIIFLWEDCWSAWNEISPRGIEDDENLFEIFGTLIERKYWTLLEKKFEEFKKTFPLNESTYFKRRVAPDIFEFYLNQAIQNFALRYVKYKTKWNALNDDKIAIQIVNELMVDLDFTLSNGGVDPYDFDEIHEFIITKFYDKIIKTFYEVVQKIENEDTESSEKINMFRNFVYDVINNMYPCDFVDFRHFYVGLKHDIKMIIEDGKAYSWLNYGMASYYLDLHLQQELLIFYKSECR